jgi:predicted deacetylase
MNYLFTPKIIFRIDDVAHNMKWKIFVKIINLFKKYKIKPILGVIAYNKDKEFKKYPKCRFNFWKKIYYFQESGYEIAMHGYQHIYSSVSNKDYLNHGGFTEFAGYSYRVQLQKLTKAKKIFNQNNIKVETFFAPNHTFDDNTIGALRNINIKYIIDGYGIAPYSYKNLIFFPQLFYYLKILPFGFQTIQLHTNYFNKNDFVNLKNFLDINKKKITNFSHIKNNNVNFNIFHLITRILIKKILVYLRSLRNKNSRTC